MNYPKCKATLIPTLFLAALTVIQFGCSGKKSEPEQVFLTDRDFFFFEGIVMFDQAVDTTVVREILTDLPFKYLDIGFSVKNKDGIFTARINSSLNPRIESMVHGSEIDTFHPYYEFKQFCNDWSYYYKIKCNKLILRNGDGLPYKRSSLMDYIKVEYDLFEGAEELAKSKHIRKIMFDKVRFSEEGRIHLHKFFEF